MVNMNKQLSLTDSFGIPLSTREVSGLVIQEVSFDSRYIPWHSHEEAHVSILLKGNHTQFCNRRAYEFQPTMVIFHPAGEEHMDHISPAGIRELTLWIRVETYYHLLPRVPVLHERQIFSGGTVVKTALRLYREFQRTDKTSQLALEALALQLLVEAQRSAKRTTRHSSRPPWIKLIEEYLHDNYLDDFTMGDLSEIAGVHVTHLERSFRQHSGYSIGEYVRRLRIEAARQELLGSKRTISDIPISHKFCDQAHFTKVFKQLTGLTPAAYRRKG